MAGNAVGSLNGQSAIGAPMGGATQIIGGKLYNQYSPEWYAAMRQNNVDVSGAAGKAAGAYTSNYLDSAFPSMAGLSGGASTGTGGPLSAFGLGGTASASGAPGTGGPVSAGGDVAPIKPPDQTASNNAIFAAAKDKVGKLSRASLDSLAGELGSQGMLGSGAQVQGTRDVIQSGLGELGQTERDLASKNVDVATDFAKTGYEGAITQRGQNIQAQEANARLALEQRQQQYQLLNLMLNGLSKVPNTTGATAPGAGGSLLY